MGVVVRWYIDILTIIINFPYSTCISSFFGSSIPTSLLIFLMFFRSCLCNFLQYNYKQTLLKEHSRSFKKIEITRIIQSVDSISKDERGFPLTQYITNGRISRGRYTFTHFKHHHRVLRLISYSMSV